MMNEKALLEFVEPYYIGKDIMHNMWHIELVKKMVNRILSIGNYKVDKECLILATYFHGFIYMNEDSIRQWLITQNYADETISNIPLIFVSETRP